MSEVKPSGALGDSETRRRLRRAEEAIQELAESEYGAAFRLSREAEAAREESRRMAERLQEALQEHGTGRPWYQLVRDIASGRLQWRRAEGAGSGATTADALVGVDAVAGPAEGSMSLTKLAERLVWYPTDAGGPLIADIRAALAEVDALRAENARLLDEAEELKRARDEWANLFSFFSTLRPEDEYHEDFGPVLWYEVPIESPPYCGTPLDDDWPFVLPSSGTALTWVFMPPVGETIERGGTEGIAAALRKARAAISAMERAE